MFGPPAPPESSPLACPNCGAEFTAPPPAFCPACGQESHIRPPRLGEFLQQFGGAYLATEGALWRTFKLLLIKPGELTRQYLAGRRKHYVLPLRLYLTISVIVLLLLRLGSGGPVEVNVNSPKSAAVAASAPSGVNSQRRITISLLGEDDMGFGLKNGVFYCRQMPDWVCKRAKKRIDIDAQAVTGELERFNDRFIGNVGAAMFLLLPSFALWMKLAYWSRHLRYTEHLVFALHVHAFWFLALALTLINQAWVQALALSAVPLYTLLAMRRVFGGRLWPRLLRSALVSFLYLVMLTLVVSLVALWTLLF